MSFGRSSLSLKDISFIEDIEKDISDFNCNNPASKRVLVFPPVSSHRRFLIHKVVEESFPNLKTFSIGEGEGRRTVVCFKKDFKQTDFSPTHTEPTPETRIPAKKPRTMPSVGIYRPPAARKLEATTNICPIGPKKPPDCTAERKSEISRVEKPAKSEENSVNMPNPQAQVKLDDKRSRQRRPDLQVYVPKGQRIAKEHQRKLEAMALNRECEGIELDLGKPFEESDSSDNEKRKTNMPKVTESTPVISNNNNQCLNLNPKCVENKFSESGHVVTVIELEISSDEEPFLKNEECVTIENVNVESTCGAAEERLALAKEDKSCPYQSIQVDKSNQAPVTELQGEPLRVQNDVNVPSVRKPNESKKSVESNVNPEECDWESLFDDSGECLMPSLLANLTKSVEQVVIESPKCSYDEYKYRNLEEEFPHVVEVYNFPPEFKTQDLVMAFSDFKHVGFEIKWVDDTHALGIFSSASIVSEVLCMKHSFIKTRCLSEGTQQSKNKARRCADSLTPYTARPDTCAALARRLVTGALGLRLPTQRAEREAEKKLLSEAREKKRLAARQREQAWEGTLS